jgi:hypothetical protein
MIQEEQVKASGRREVNADTFVEAHRWGRLCYSQNKDPPGQINFRKTLPLTDSPMPRHSAWSLEYRLDLSIHFSPYPATLIHGTLGGLTLNAYIQQSELGFCT